MKNLIFLSLMFSFSVGNANAKLKDTLSVLFHPKKHAQIESRLQEKNGELLRDDERLKSETERLQGTVSVAREELFSCQDSLTKSKQLLVEAKEVLLHAKNIIENQDFEIKFCSTMRESDQILAEANCSLEIANANMESIAIVSDHLDFEGGLTANLLKVAQDIAKNSNKDYELNIPLSVEDRKQSKITKIVAHADGTLTFSDDLETVHTSFNYETGEMNIIEE